MTFTRVGVYCGSSSGLDPVFAEAARQMADYLVEKEMTMVNGGGSIGLMGVMADRMLEQGGRCIGVIPLHLKERELEHKGMTELITTSGMHGRKRVIMELCDAFVALPGGYGTLDELFECITWRQLNLHQKPVGVLNVEGYFDPVIRMVAKMQEKGFMNVRSQGILLHDESVDGLFRKMHAADPIFQNKWLS